MEKVEVTEEMRSRILRNIQNADLSRVKAMTEEPVSRMGNIIHPSRWQKYLSIAAGVLVLLGTALVLPHLLRNAAETGTPGSVDTGTFEAGTEMQQGDFAVTEYASLEELSQAVGFTVAVPEKLPFTVSSTSYVSYGGEIAQIDYTGSEGQTVSCRMSEGTEDNSGDYNTYAAETQIAVTQNISGAEKEAAVTLKGTEGAYTLALWNDGTCAYSICFSEGMDETEWKNVIEGIR